VVVKISKSAACGNCGTERYPQYRRGYCEDCYRLKRRLEKISKWDPSDPDTLDKEKEFRKGGGPPSRLNLKGESVRYILGFHPKGFDQEVQQQKSQKLQEITKKLKRLKTMESQRAGDIDGINIEHAFRRLAKYAGVTNDSVLYGIASLVTAEFDEKQMRILFGFLLDIEERVTVRKRKPRKQYPPTPSTVAGK